MLVQVKYKQQQTRVKLDEVDGQFDLLQFCEKVIERFCLPPDANIIYKDATGTEADAEIFSDLVGQGNVVLTVSSNDDSPCLPLLRCLGQASAQLHQLIVDEVPSKRLRIEETPDAVSAKQLIKAVL